VKKKPRLNAVGLKFIPRTNDHRSWLRKGRTQENFKCPIHPSL